MFASSQIIFINSRSEAECLDWLLAELPQRVPFDCLRTEWRGFTTTVPQVLVQTSPVALTIQLEDDPEYVPDEIAELADEIKAKLPAEAHALLSNCNARLDIMTATPVEPGTTDDAIKISAQTDLDPQSDEADLVVRALASLCNGIVSDCVNGGVLCPGSDSWIM